MNEGKGRLAAGEVKERGIVKGMMPLGLAGGQEVFRLLSNLINKSILIVC